ncbi:MAG: TetR/AcrR family transcriptional regulator [Elusimicrobia bacterium]|nr:TetR/AcrR family transcriptional regulator [Elusimicrobiota bacterium]
MTRKNRQDGDATRKRILDEAEHLIHVHGFRGTSLEDIARRCGVTKANLLHHFRSKEELGLAVLDYKAECYRACLSTVFAPGKSAEQAIHDVFEQAASFLKGNGCKAGCFIGNIALEMSDVDARFRERAGRFFSEWAAALERLIAAAGHNGESRAAAESVLALYEGATMLARTQRDPSVFERTRDTALALIRSRPKPRLHGR